MPTAAKLVGAVLFGGIGWAAALLVLRTFPPGMPATYFPAVIAVIGLWQGWAVTGAHAGSGMGRTMGQGVRAAIQMLLVGVMVFALREMFRRSANLAYDYPGEAAIAALDLAIGYVVQSLVWPVWATLILGGLAAGALVEVAARRWR